MRPTDPFDALLHRYRGMLFALCRRYSRRGATVDDLLQEASLALWRSSEQLAGIDNLLQQARMVWRIGRNAMVDTLRRTPLTEPLPEGYDNAEADSTLVRHLHEAIGHLDEPDRTIVNLQLEGYSYEEIAQQTGLTVKNVSVRLTRIKEKLRKELI